MAWLGFEGFSRDLLERFGGDDDGEDPTEMTGGESDEIELSLGLSLGGCFGGEEGRSNKLVRSSSIASLSSLPKMVGLVRTSSLPVESEEEWRKRRLEAKRKRLERKNSMKSSSSSGLKAVVGDDDLGVGRSGIPVWLVGGKRRREDDVDDGRYRSIGSQGSSSSCGIDFDCNREQGSASSTSNGGIEAKNSSAPHHVSKKPQTSATTTISRGSNEQSSKKGVQSVNGTKNAEINVMEDMPCVATKGLGPNGRRIEGFLYKYRKGEEVSIVCVCHGSFLTPAEFVKHAGGGDVAFPMKHIVVNPSPTEFM